MTDHVDRSYPPRNLKSDEEVICYIAEHGVSRLDAQGYSWFWNVYIPTLDRVIESASVEAETIAENFHVIGDVHDFHEAPRAAISAYKKALEFAPELNAAHREIANMYHRLGFIDAAIHHIDLALALWPDEPYALADRIDILEDKNDPEPYYENFNPPKALALEALAKQSPNKAIKLLKGTNDPESLRVLTWAFAAADNTEAYLATWKSLLPKIRETSPKKELCFNYGDFFYMSEDIYGGDEIWNLWKNSGLNFCGVFWDYEGLDDKDAPDVSIDEKFSKLSTFEQIEQKLEYLYLVYSKNLEGLKALQEVYPNWKDLNEDIIEIERQQE